jgi:hypothetical protein
MLVKDILEDVKDTLGQCPSQVFYRRLNMAINMLANMGDGLWEGLTGQMDIVVSPSNRLVTFPRDVLTPIAINVDDNTSFPRDRWFQYRLASYNGLDKDNEIAWTDVGISSTFLPITTATKLKCVSSNASDNGKTITIRGLNSSGREISETLTMNYTTAPETTLTFSSVTSVVKEETLYSVELKRSSDSITIGWYYPDETNPEYRQVEVKATNFITLAYRRRTIEVSGIDDYIPLKNQLAIIQAVRSVKYRFTNMLEEAQSAQIDAFQLLMDEQRTRNIKHYPVSPIVENLANDPLKYPVSPIPNEARR